MRLTVLENMLVATQRDEGWLRGSCAAPARRPSSGGRWSCWTSSASRGWPTSLPGTSPTASASCWSWPRCSSPIRPSCCSTSRPAASTRRSSATSPTGSRELNRGGKTILVVEHNMEFVMSLCSRITVLSQGTALVSGTPAEVRNNPAVLDAYLGGEDDASTQQELAAQAARPRAAGRAPSAGRARRRPSPWTARRRCCASRRDRRIRRRRHPQGGLARGAPREHHLRRRPQRRRQVDADGDDQRAAAPRAGARSTSTATPISGLTPKQILAAGSRRSPRRTACSTT